MTLATGPTLINLNKGSACCKCSRPATARTCACAARASNRLFRACAHSGESYNSFEGSVAHDVSPTMDLPPRPPSPKSGTSAIVNERERMRGISKRKDAPKSNQGINRSDTMGRGSNPDCKQTRAFHVRIITIIGVSDSGTTRSLWTFESRLNRRILLPMLSS